MKYLVLIYRNQPAFLAMSEAERADLFRRYREYGEFIAASGHIVHGEFLEPPDTTTQLRVREGKRLVTDGPFAETAEQIAGSMILECADLDQVLGLVERHPDAEWAHIEIRPVVDWKG